MFWTMMRWQKRISTFAPFLLGLLHLHVQANGIQSSLNNLIIPTIDQFQIESPIFSEEEDNIHLQQRSNNAFVDPPRFPPNNDWYGFDIVQDYPLSKDDVNDQSSSKEEHRQNDPKRSIKRNFLDLVKNDFHDQYMRFRKATGAADNEHHETQEHNTDDTLGLTSREYKTIRDLLKTAGVDLNKSKDESNNTMATDATEEEGGDEQVNVEDARGIRMERSIECPESPPGVPYKCIPCPNDDRQDSFWHTDVKGKRCLCDMCMAPTYLISPCVCKADGQVAHQPTCGFPEEGKTFMPFPNWCPKPFDCKTCKVGDLVVTSQCSSNEDADCGCPDDMDQTGESSCAPKPLCMENEESVRVHKIDTLYPSHICQPCEEGYIQPNNFTLDKCYLPKDDAFDEQTSKNLISSHSEAGVTEAITLLKDIKNKDPECKPKHESTPRPTPHTVVSSTNDWIHPILAASMTVFGFCLGAVVAFALSPIYWKKKLAKKNKNRNQNGRGVQPEYIQLQERPGERPDGRERGKGRGRGNGGGSGSRAGRGGGRGRGRGK